MTTPSSNVMPKPNGVLSEDPAALFKQSLCYMEGKDRKKNPVMAVHLCQRAAEQGFDPARLRLGYWYEWGKGVFKDLKRAQYWYVTAAKSFEAKAAQGNARAQCNLGMKYHEGKGIEKDHILAHMWINVAAINGLSGAARVQDIVSKMMSASQIEKAQDFARECIKNNYKGF